MTSPLIPTLFLAVLLAASGCRTSSPWTVTDAGRPRYRSAEIVYELAGPDCMLPLDPRRTADEVAVVDYSDDDLDAAAPVTWSAARLRIEYPHPEAGEEYARAELKLSRDPLPEPEKPDSFLGRIGQAVKDSYRRVLRGSNSEYEHRVVVELSRAQLDRLLTDLQANGYFEEQTRPLGGATLTAQVGRSKHSKNWTPEPVLDRLMTRIYRNSQGTTRFAEAEGDAIDLAKAK